MCSRTAEGLWRPCSQPPCSSDTAAVQHPWQHSNQESVENPLHDSTSTTAKSVRFVNHQARFVSTIRESTMKENKSKVDGISKFFTHAKCWTRRRSVIIILILILGAFPPFYRGLTESHMNCGSGALYQQHCQCNHSRQTCKLRQNKRGKSKKGT